MKRPTFRSLAASGQDAREPRARRAHAHTQGGWARAAAILAALGLLATACADPGAQSGLWQPLPDPPAEPDEPSGLACDSPRSALDSVSAPIVAGSPSWDPAVVALTPGQALAVGAIMTEGWGGGYDNTCTGTLIAPNAVLTAAHCLLTSSWYIMSPHQVRFAVGPNVAQPVHTFQVSQLHVNTGYAGGARNDVAVLILAEDATAVLANIEPIPLNCSALSNAGFVGEVIQTVGYGATNRAGTQTTTQRGWAVQDIVDLRNRSFTVHGNGVSGVCYGDSGGPGLFTTADGQVRIVGTLSWGDEVCTYRDHFTRTDRECDFITPLLPACGSVTTSGACQGATAVFCQHNAVVEQDCAATGGECVLDGQGRARCAAPAPGCGAETAAGRCDGTTVVICVGDGVVYDECSARGQVCEVSGGQARCAVNEPEPEPDPCGDETWAGRCDGPTIVWCEGGAVQTRDCAECERTCGWSVGLSAFDCL